MEAPEITVSFLKAESTKFYETIMGHISKSTLNLSFLLYPDRHIKIFLYDGVIQSNNV